MTTYLEAIYIGQDGHEYHQEQKYCLELRQHWFGRISVRPTHGYHYKPLEGMKRSYHSLKSFLIHWSIISVVEPQSQSDAASDTEQ